MPQLRLHHLLRLWHEKTGQGLVEYVMILALVSFGAAAGMNSVASVINSAFTKIGGIFGQYIS